MALEHPYVDTPAGRWLRGNLHTHTTQSDGTRTPQEVIDDYAQRGYDFLMLSDHDICTSADRLAELDDRGMVLIPGNEVSAGGPHLLHVGAAHRVEPHAQRQRVLDEIAGTEGFAIVNHPNWQRAFDHCPLNCMQEWVGYAGLEIYNGVISRLEGSPYATNKWDMLLAQGLQLWGYAHDDSHHEIDVELGWNVVRVVEPTRESVVDALRSGNFYASTGVTISAIHVDGDRITIDTENARRIVALTDCGKRFATADVATMEVEAPATGCYVRFECWGDGEQMAWTQPFFIES